MRLAVAIGVIAVTLAAAVYVHQRRIEDYGLIGQCVAPPGQLYGDQHLDQTSKAACLFAYVLNSWRFERTPLGLSKPSWEDPVAVLLSLGGFAVAVGIAYRR